MGGKLKKIADEHWRWDGGKWGIINKKGEIVLPPTYEDGYAGGIVIDGKFVLIEEILGLK